MASDLCLDQVPELRQSYVHMKNPDKVEKLLRNIKAGKKEDLLVMADFDYTITKQHIDGKNCLTSFGVLSGNTLLPEEFNKRHKEIFSFYYPIEIDPKLSFEEKFPYMMEWYNKDTNLIVEYKVNKKDIVRMVNNCLIHFRDGTDMLLKFLWNEGIPVMLISAGLGDVIVEILKSKQLFNSDLHILSNFFSSDSEGYITGLDGERLHMYNKNAMVANYLKKYPELAEKKNVIVLGDTLPDATMTDDVSCQALKIGFLYSNVEERLEQFLESFDIVLVDDQTMAIPNTIVRNVIA